MSDKATQCFLFKFIAGVFFFSIVLSFFHTSLYAGEFDLTELDPARVITIPGTNMKAGVFSYRVTEENESDKAGDWTAKNAGDLTNKAGILVPGDTLYYLDAFDPGGDCHFGIYKDYFLMDCFVYGASHNRIMYTFRYGKKIEFVALLGGMGDDFFTATVDDGKPDLEQDKYNSPTWMEIKDIDNDGKPEVRLKIFILDEDPFALYLQLKDDDLFFNLNSAIYKPFFEKEKKKKRSKKKSNAYYVYGFLSRALTLDEIKGELVSDKRRYKKIVTRLLERKNMQIPDYHNPDWIKPTLKRYDLKGR